MIPNKKNLIGILVGTLWASPFFSTVTANAAYKGNNSGPYGSYQSTCMAFKQSGNDLFAVCENRKAFNTRTSWLPLNFCSPKYDIWNDKGILKCRNNSGIIITSNSISTSAANSEICDWDIDLNEPVSFIFKCRGGELQKYSFLNLFQNCRDLSEVVEEIKCISLCKNKQ